MANYYNMYSGNQPFNDTIHLNGPAPLDDRVVFSSVDGVYFTHGDKNHPLFNRAYKGMQVVIFDGSASIFMILNDATPYSADNKTVNVTAQNYLDYWAILSGSEYKIVKAETANAGMISTYKLAFKSPNMKEFQTLEDTVIDIPKDYVLKEVHQCKASYNASANTYTETSFPNDSKWATDKNPVYIHFIWQTKDSTTATSHTYLKVADVIKVDLTELNSSVSALETHFSTVVDPSINKLENRVGKVDTSIGTLNSSVSGLETHISKTDVSINTINSSVNGLESHFVKTDSSIGTLNSSVSGLETHISKTDSSINTIDSSVNKLETRLGKVDTSIGTLNSSVNGLETHISKTDSSINTINSSVNKLETRLGKVDTSIGILNSSVSALETHFSTVVDPSVNILETHLGKVDTSIGTLNSSVSGLETHISKTDVSINTINSSIGTLKTSVSGLETHISNTDVSINTINSSVSGLETHIEEIDASVSVLDTSVGKLYVDFESFGDEIDTLNSSYNNLVEEIVKNEKVTAAALTDLNKRVTEISNNSSNNGDLAVMNSNMNYDADLAFADSSGNVIMKLSDGQIQTKEFNSAYASKVLNVEDIFNSETNNTVDTISYSDLYNSKMITVLEDGTYVDVNMGSVRNIEPVDNKIHNVLYYDYFDSANNSIPFGRAWVHIKVDTVDSSVINIVEKSV